MRRTGIRTPHVPGGIPQRVVFLPEAIRLSRPGVRHVVTTEELGGILAFDLGIPLGPAVDLVSLVESEEIVVDVKTGLLVNRLLVFHVLAFCGTSSATVTGLGRQLIQTA